MINRMTLEMVTKFPGRKKNESKNKNKKSFNHNQYYSQG